MTGARPDGNRAASGGERVGVAAKAGYGRSIMARAAPPPERRFTTAPSLDEIEALAAEAYTTIPEELRRHVGDVVIRIEEFPDSDTEDVMELDSPFDLLCLYRGVALPQQGAIDVRSDIDMIFLYRRPLLDYWCETGEDLSHLVRHVLIHEIGHHFGFSDDDMETLEEMAAAEALRQLEA
jgi:predicted Zn-dependent protease with MMP-like domain